MVLGWSASTPQPVTPTILVNEVSYKVKVVYGTVLSMIDKTYSDGRSNTPWRARCIWVRLVDRVDSRPHAQGRRPGRLDAR